MKKLIKKYLPYLLTAAIIFLAAGFYIDRTSTISSNGLSPTTDNRQSMAAGLKNYGQAPAFAGINNWINSNALTMQSLHGKVVLIDFWTYSCINCIRTLPHVIKWYDTYKDQGFVVIGVHTPEFEFEKTIANVETAVKRHGIIYPVAQDNNFATWNAYKNRFWPAKYLIDKEGNIRYTHFGEGEYDTTENAIRDLLGLDEMANSNNDDNNNLKQARSPEMYFGTNRLENLASGQSASLQTTSYSLPTTLKLNTFALEGRWEFDGERARLVSGSGKIALKFFAGKVHMVAKADQPVKIKSYVDGQLAVEVEINFSDLYTLFDSQDYREHNLIIEIQDAGFEAFTFTFG